MCLPLGANWIFIFNLTLVLKWLKHRFNTCCINYEIKKYLRSTSREKLIEYKMTHKLGEIRYITFIYVMMAIQTKYIPDPEGNWNRRVGSLVNNLTVAHTIYHMWSCKLSQTRTYVRFMTTCQVNVYTPVWNKVVLLVLQNVGKKPIELRLP